MENLIQTTIMLNIHGIKIWMLTGDKIETTINIGYACSLINNEMKQFIISSEIDAIRKVEDRFNTRHIVPPAFKGYGGHMVECTKEKVESLENMVNYGVSEVEIREYITNLIIDIIFRTEFGISYEKGK